METKILIEINLKYLINYLCPNDSGFVDFNHFLKMMAGPEHFAVYASENHRQNLAKTKNTNAPKAATNTNLYLPHMFIRC